jgi:nucleotide-binding universal stress UspA family protein
MKKAPQKILVSLKQAEDAEALISLATHVAAPRKATFVVLNVLELPEITPLDVKDKILEAPVRAVERAYKKQIRKYPRRKFTLRLLRAHHAGKAIVEELKEGKFDLAIIGYHHKRSLADLLLGTTAQYLAKHAPCRLLMSVPARP